MKKMICAALAVFASPVFAADSANSDFKAGDWMIRARALGVLPQVSSSTNIGTKIDIDNSLVPEADFTYFFTPHISAELIAAVTPHNLKTRSGTDAGSAWLLPPTLTAQYHFTECPFMKPYLGVGINYTRFFNEDAGALTRVKYDNNSWGGALQAGVDIPLKNNWYLNADIKKVYISTTARYSPSGAVAKVDIDPLLVGIGVGYKF